MSAVSSNVQRRLLILLVLGIKQRGALDEQRLCLLDFASLQEAMNLTRRCGWQRDRHHLPEQEYEEGQEVAMGSHGLILRNTRIPKPRSRAVLAVCCRQGYLC